MAPPEQDDSESNAIESVNASVSTNRKASTSYSLLCDKNVLSWTHSGDMCGIGGYVDRTDYQKLDGETQAAAVNESCETCNFPDCQECQDCPEC